MAYVNQPKLILYIIILLGFAGGYVFYTQGTVEEIFVPLAEENDSIDGLKDLNIDFSVLNSEKLKSLKIFGEFPIQPGQTGKRDIFAPIQ